MGKFLGAFESMFKNPGMEWGDLLVTLMWSISSGNKVALAKRLIVILCGRLAQSVERGAVNSEVDSSNLSLTVSFFLYFLEYKKKQTRSLDLTNLKHVSEPIHSRASPRIYNGQIP